VTPHLDYHALAPEIVITAVTLIALVVDLVWRESARNLVPQIAGIGMLLALIPVLTLAADGTDRSMFGGAFVVDNYSLAFTGFFLVVGYVTLLLSYDYIAEGDYYQGEYYVLILTSVLGMMVMASARDLISIFVALETITLPTFVLAGWRKYDTKSNEAAIKYFLIGVLSTAVMLYGMSFIFGLSHSTLLSDIAKTAAHHPDPLFAVAVFLTLGGFAFKISAVPFHFWAPDTYEGAPTPVTAFLSVASKAGGFVALVLMIYLAFPQATDIWEPFIFVLSALTMTVGNVLALRQTNVVRMLAYSSIAQGGFMLVPFAAGTTSAVILGVIAAVFSVVAFFYYVAITRQMWFREPADLGEVASSARTPLALNVALTLTTIVVVVVGVYPQLFARIGDLAFRST